MKSLNFRPLLLVAATAGILAGCPSKPQPVAFTPRLPDPAAVAKQLEQDVRDLGGYQPAGAAKELVDRFVAFNRLAALPVPAEQELAEAGNKVRNAVRQLLDQGQGQQETRQVCLLLLSQFEDHLKALLALRFPGDPANLLKGIPPPMYQKPYQEFAEVGGDFLPVAATNGLIVPAGDDRLTMVDGAEFFIRLAFKVRFAGIIPDSYRPADWLLSEFERGWYNIWVVERSRTAPLQRRLQAIADIKARDPAYPDKRARGVVLFQNQDFTQAASAFEEALKEKPDDAMAKAFLAQAKNMVH